MSRSHVDLLAADRAHLIHPLHNPTLHESAHIWTRGEGALLFDAEGHEFIDVLSGLWNVVAGHGRRELIEAARLQAEQLSYCSLYSGSSNIPAIELAERLAGIRQKVRVAQVAEDIPAEHLAQPGRAVSHNLAALLRECE